MARTACLVCGGPLDKGYRAEVLYEITRLRDTDRRLAELVEAVRWERECGEMRFTDIWFDEWSRTESQSKNAMRELRATVDAARAEVDRLLAEEGI